MGPPNPLRNHATRRERAALFYAASDVNQPLAKTAALMKWGGDVTSTLSLPCTDWTREEYHYFEDIYYATHSDKHFSRWRREQLRERPAHLEELMQPLGEPIDIESIDIADGFEAGPGSRQGHVPGTFSSFQFRPDDQMSAIQDPFQAGSAELNAHLPFVELVDPHTVIPGATRPLYVDPFDVHIYFPLDAFYSLERSTWHPGSQNGQDNKLYDVISIFSKSSPESLQDSVRRWGDFDYDPSDLNRMRKKMRGKQTAEEPCAKLHRHHEAQLPRESGRKRTKPRRKKRC